MSVPNREFFHQYTYGAGYDPVWYHGYDPSWLSGLQTVPLPVAGTSAPAPTADKELTELRVPLCCDGCVEKVHKKLKALEVIERNHIMKAGEFDLIEMKNIGVESVHCDAATYKVTVRGPAKPERILKEVKKIKHLQRSELWKAPGKSKS